MLVCIHELRAYNHLVGTVGLPFTIQISFVNSNCKLFTLTGIGPRIEQYYNYFISASCNIQTVFDIDSEHGQVKLHFYYKLNANFRF